MKGDRNLLLDSKQVCQGAGELEEKLGPMMRYNRDRKAMQADNIIKKQVCDSLWVDFSGSGNIISHFG